jgi:hypothetical protein
MTNVEPPCLLGRRTGIGTRRDTRATDQGRHDMTINPTVLAVAGLGVVGAGIGTATAFGLTHVNDKLIAEHPTGTKGDFHTNVATFGTAIGGGAAIAAGGGAFLGAIAGGIATHVRNGEATESVVQGVFNNYDRSPRNGSLDLTDKGFFSPAETSRTETTTTTDSKGNVHQTHSTYSIARLATAADERGNQNGLAETNEVRPIVTSFDKDGDERLKGAELKDFNRQFGEQLVSYYSF